MLLLDRQTGATGQPRGDASRPGATAVRVQLRLRADGQVVELPPGKTTIGSSPRCNVRIELPGIQPLHCLIVESPEGLRIRSWVANTTLNGMPFDESPLKVGDVLCLGSVEVDVVDPQAAPVATVSKEAPAVESEDSTQIREGRDRARARSRQLVKSLRRERASHHELREQVAKLQESHLDAITEQNELSNRLERCLAELEAARGQLSDNESVESARRELASQNEQLGFEVGELSAQVNELTHELTSARSEGAKQRKQLTDDLTAMSEQRRRLKETNAQLQRDLGQMSTEKSAIDEKNTQLLEQVLELQGEVSRFADEKHSASEEHWQLVDANSRLQSDIVQLANEKASVDERCQQLSEQKSQLQDEFDCLVDEKNTLIAERERLGEANSQLQGDLVQLANEKGAADEQVRQLTEQKTQLQSEVAYLSHQKDELEEEREGLRRQTDQLLHEARDLTGERTSLAEERTSLCMERSELRQQNESLRNRIAQLNDENSAMAVGKLTLVDQRDAMSREVEQLRVRVSELSEENNHLAMTKEALADEQARLVAEQKRLVELEREMTAAVSGRENTSAELYHALLQLAEMQDRDAQNKAVVEAYETLSKEHDLLHEQTDQLKQQVESLAEERTAVETAWQTLSAEAAALGASQEQLSGDNAKLLAGLDRAKDDYDHLQASLDAASDENAKLLASLEEIKGQLGLAQQDQHALALTAEELESERTAKQQVATEAAAALAECERRIEDQERRIAEQSQEFAEQSQQFAERSSQLNEQARQYAEEARELAKTVEHLEQQLAATGDLHTSLAQTRENAHSELARARNEAEVQLAEAESQRVEQARRIEELELQLAAAEDRAAKAAEVAANQVRANLEHTVTEAARRAAQHEVRESTPESESRAEFGWATGRETNAREEVTADDQLNFASGGVVETETSVEESTPTTASAWERSADGVDAWHSGGTQREDVEPIAARDESKAWSEPVALLPAVDASALGDDEESSVAEPQAVESPTPEISSGWKQVVEQPETAFDEPVFAKSDESASSGPQVESVPAAKHEPPSFIDRYSHMFDASGANEEKPLRVPEPVKPIVPARPEVPSAASSNSEDEDSIEQYMAKLLQRVRGESTPAAVAAPEQPLRMPLNAPNGRPAIGANEQTSPLPAVEGEADEAADPSANAPRPVWRKPSAPMPATDLGALREIANETARMAISRHEFRTRRGKSITKIIVSTLAGMTSLWLMLDSPDWVSVQFIVACVSLVVAAFWAGETFRTFFKLARKSAYEGSAGVAGNGAFEVPGLPIDVESKE